MSFSAYIICTTPRSGSTLLCDLLTATGIAGQPNSYFRCQDIGYWASLWGTDDPTTTYDPRFNLAYLAAMKRAGSADTGVFGLRLMWQSVRDTEKRLSAALGKTADVATLFEEAFGPTLFIHLSRQDKDAQAVSLVRAEQTGLWHVATDGSERERAKPYQAPVFNAAQINQARQKLTANDANWSSFFDLRGIRPLRIFYEDLANNPQVALAGVLSGLGREANIALTVSPSTIKMADHSSFLWKQQIEIK